MKAKVLDRVVLKMAGCALAAALALAIPAAVPAQSQGAITPNYKDADLGQIIEAVSADFSNRSRHETLVAEIIVSISAAKGVKHQLRRWMRPRKAPPAAFRPMAPPIEVPSQWHWCTPSWSSSETASRS